MDFNFAEWKIDLNCFTLCYFTQIVKVYSVFYMLYVKFTKETCKSSRVNNIGTVFPFGILAMVYSLLVLSFYNINVVIKLIINVLLCDKN